MTTSSTSGSSKIFAWILLLQVVSAHGELTDLSQDVTLDLPQTDYSEIQYVQLNSSFTSTRFHLNVVEVDCVGDHGTLRRVCPLRSTPDCRYEELQRYFQQLEESPDTLKEVEVRTNGTDPFVEVENLEDGEYELEIHGCNKTIPICVYHSEESDGAKWNLTFELKSSPGGIMRLYMIEFPQMTDLFDFKQFLVELQDLSSSNAVVNHTVLSYHGNGQNITFDFHNVSNGTYWALVTPVDCRCVVSGEFNKVPCQRHSNNETVLIPSSESRDESKVTPQNLLWCIIPLVVLAIVILAGCIRRYGSRKKGNRFVTDGSDTSDVTVSLEESLLSEPGDIQVLLLYDRADDRLKSKAAELGSILRCHPLYCIVHDYGDPGEEDSVHIEGVQWFASRMSRRMSRVVVITSAGLQNMEQAILDTEGVDATKMEIDPVSLGALNCVMTLNYGERGSYDRLICVRFTGLDEESDCKTLVPLQRFTLPLHMDDLMRHLS